MLISLYCVCQSLCEYLCYLLNIELFYKVSWYMVNFPLIPGSCIQWPLTKIPRKPTVRRKDVSGKLISYLRWGFNYYIYIHTYIYTYICTVCMYAYIRVCIIMYVCMYVLYRAVVRCTYTVTTHQS